MTLFEQLKKDRMEAMYTINSDKVIGNLLSSVIADASRCDKDPDDDSVMETIRSTVKKLTETLSYARGDLVPIVEKELDVLKAYLPKEATEDEIREFVATLPEGQPGPKIGKVKKHFDGNVDMELVKRVIFGG